MKSRSRHLREIFREPLIEGETGRLGVHAGQFPPKLIGGSRCSGVIGQKSDPSPHEIPEDIGHSWFSNLGVNGRDQGMQSCAVDTWGFDSLRNEDQPPVDDSIRCRNRFVEMLPTAGSNP